MSVYFFVSGLPISQGSMRAWVVGGKAFTVHAKSEKLAVWRNQIADAVRGKTIPDSWLLGAAIQIDIKFILPRPKTLPRKIVYPVKRPDLDKLIRAVFDALSKKVYQDDSQVVKLTARKSYGITPGVSITVKEMDDDSNA